MDWLEVGALLITGYWIGSYSTLLALRRWRRYREHCGLMLAEGRRNRRG